MPAGIFGRLVFNNAIFNTGTGDFGTVTCEYFFTNFEDSSIGDAPPTGWTARGPSGYQTLAVANSSPPFKRRVATLNSEDGAIVAFSVDSIDAFAGRADMDVVVAIYRDATTDHERVAVHVRGQGSGTVTAGYEFAVDFTNQRVRIYKRVASTPSNPFADLAITHAAGEWMLYRFRANGDTTTALKVRTWAPGDTEPAAWGLEESDSSSPITAAGWVGFGGYVPSGTGESKLNFFSAASGGCSAYVPVLNDAFLTWLNTQSRRCVLAEMSATGYDGDASPAATRTVNAYIANMGFTSKASDTPPNKHYNAWIQKVPTFRREMSAALSGRATSGFGSLVVANPASALDTGGVRDDWLRMKWNRDSITLYLGDVTWRKSDFRKIIVGVLGQPTGKQQALEFPISDIMERLNRQLQTNTFASGPFENKLKPMLFGDVLWLEPVPTDTTGLTYQVNDGPIVRIGDVYDDGISLTSTGSIASVDTGTNIITMSAAHGLSADARIVFSGSHLPAPLVAGVTYWVIASGLGASDLKVSATQAGSEVDLTTAGSGGRTFVAKSWNENLSVATITLVVQPVGRIMCFDVAQTLSFLPGAVIDEIVFDKFGLSRDFKDQDAFDALDTDLAAEVVGLMQYDPPLMTLAALERVSAGVNGWYGTSLDGLLQVGIVSLPAATAVMELKAKDVKVGSLALLKRIMPINRDTLEVRVNRRQLLNGAMNLPATNANRAAINQPFDIVRTAFPGSPSVPLDNYPEIADSRDMEPVDSVLTTQVNGILIVTGAADRLSTLFAKTLGVFTFQARIRAITLQIGDTIQLEHPRMGWRQWDIYDPASPDNPDDTDATRAVVIGIDVNLSANDPFPVKLTVFRQIPGYYPEEDLN